jgi:DNA repair ATPase RecN
MRDEAPDLDIDLTRLEREWVEQPARYHECAERLADARRLLDEKKLELDVVHAELDHQIRKAPEQFAVPKLTEEVVKQTIVLQSTYQKASRELIDARHEAALAQAACDAMDHRKKALENAVHLFCADYFSAPRAPKEARERVEEDAKRDVRKRGKKVRGE